VRRLTLLLAGGAVWLFLAAVPVLADGGPHIASLNSGSTGINADSCAACHRAHTAQASYLLIEEQPAMCVTCHGDAGLGAATNVESGLQYVLDGSGSRTSAVLGALRNGGFETARIASNSAYSVGYIRNTSGDISFRIKVPVASTGVAVTSAHMPLTGPGEGEAWGNGPLNSGPGAAVEVECTTCHNPHGNGNYRILNPVPQPGAVTGGGTFVATTGAAIVLDDSANVNVTRNYTVIQLRNGTGSLTATQVAGLGLPDTAGDYMHRVVPWDPQVPYNAPPAAGTTANDAPNGIPATFGTQIAAWCITCHSRYASEGWAVNTGDNIFKYRHTSQNTQRNCVTCHVAHGSNAVMNGWNSTHSAYPNADGTGGTYEPFTATASTDSRLLKIDNRGTCQACHDPTGTVVAGQVRPTGASAPVPYVP
jgi:predicted CXXCH cytochrome family protein